MERTKLGRSDLQVSRLCMGTWNMGGGDDWGPEDDRNSVELLRRAQDAGINFFDSAHGYGNGHAEEVLGEALAEGDRRENAVVATKVLHHNNSDGVVERQLDPALKRLGMDYVDLYIVHWPNLALDIRPFLEQMFQMVEKGKARHIGVSNFYMDRLPVAEEMGIVSLQPPYNVVWRHLDTDGLNFCSEHDIAVTPYSPLAQGLLTGRFTRGDEEPHASVREKNLIFQEPHFEKCKEAASVVDEVADQGGWSSAQVALAWLLHTPGVTAPIVGASSWDQMQDNIHALDIELSKEQYERISAAGLAAWNCLPDDAAMWGWKLSSPNEDA